MQVYEPGAELLKVAMPESIFLLEPYIPKSSVVLLYGKPSLGKTPLAWQLAQAVQTGQSLWGLPVQQANVLFLELDMPIELAHERWTNADPMFEPQFVTVFNPTSVDCLQFMSPYPDEHHRHIVDEFRRLHLKYGFGLVCVDALREVVIGDLNPGGTPRRIYDAFKTMFPGASLLFIHHEKKTPSGFGSNSIDPMQMASGNMEFMNVAQIGLQFHKVGRETYLSHLKTQASVKFDPMPLAIMDDGVHFTNKHEERNRAAVELIKSAPAGMGMRELDKLVGARLGVSDRTARTIRKGLGQSGALA